MRKFILSAALVVGWSVESRATMIVHDPIHTVQDAMQEVVNLVKWSSTEINTANQYVEQVRQYEAQVMALTRLGDANAIRNLVGVSAVGQLAYSSQRLYNNVSNLAQAQNYGGYQADLNSILSRYGQPAWNGYTTASGYQVAPSQTAYQFDTAKYNVTMQVQKLLGDVQGERQTLIAKRDAIYQRLNSASTEAEVSKVGHDLNAVNAALAQLDKRHDQAVQGAQLEHQKIEAARAIAQTSQAQQSQMQALQAADAELTQLPSTGFHQLPRWSN